MIRVNQHHSSLPLINFAADLMLFLLWLCPLPFAPGCGTQKPQAKTYEDYCTERISFFRSAYSRNGHANDLGLSSLWSYRLWIVDKSPELRSLAIRTAQEAATNGSPYGRLVLAFVSAAQGPYSFVMNQEQAREMRSITTELHQQASNGVSEAQFLLGFFNEFGVGDIQKSQDRAQPWYQKAAIAGHALAQYHYASLLIDKGGKQNLQEAVKYIHGAITNGIPGAVETLHIAEFALNRSKTGRTEFLTPLNK